MNATKLKILGQLKVYLNGCEKFAFLCNELDRLAEANIKNTNYVIAAQNLKTEIQLGIDNEYTLESWLYKQFGWNCSMGSFDYGDPNWERFRNWADAQAIKCRMAWVDKMIYDLTTQEGE